ncbi:MAG: hypothetical protein AUJ57_05155 [Zetaproteobacteria bacterium CG1_02_53_45]|nr:MAG: hypothetical protein AUJ57_05155 [Zetaproteobacteria bacterium CG1_02_53_45]
MLFIDKQIKKRGDFTGPVKQLLVQLEIQQHLFNCSRIQASSYKSIIMRTIFLLQLINWYM